MGASQALKEQPKKFNLSHDIASAQQQKGLPALIAESEAKDKDLAERLSKRVGSAETFLSGAYGPFGEFEKSLKSLKEEEKKEDKKVHEDAGWKGVDANFQNATLSYGRLATETEKLEKELLDLKAAEEETNARIEEKKQTLAWRQDGEAKEADRFTRKYDLRSVVEAERAKNPNSKIVKEFERDQERLETRKKGSEWTSEEFAKAEKAKRDLDPKATQAEKEKVEQEFEMKRGLAATYRREFAEETLKFGKKYDFEAIIKRFGDADKERAKNQTDLRQDMKRVADARDATKDAENELKTAVHKESFVAKEIERVTERITEANTIKGQTLALTMKYKEEKDAIEKKWRTLKSKLEEKNEVEVRWQKVNKIKGMVEHFRKLSTEESDTAVAWLQAMAKSFKEDELTESVNVTLKGGKGTALEQWKERLMQESADAAKEYQNSGRGRSELEKLDKKLNSYIGKEKESSSADRESRADYKYKMLLGYKDLDAEMTVIFGALNELDMTAIETHVKEMGRLNAISRLTAEARTKTKNASGENGIVASIDFVINAKPRDYRLKAFGVEPIEQVAATAAAQNAQSNGSVIQTLGGASSGTDTVSNADKKAIEEMNEHFKQLNSALGKVSNKQDHDNIDEANATNVMLILKAQILAARMTDPATQAAIAKIAKEANDLMEKIAKDKLGFKEKDLIQVDVVKLRSKGDYKYIQALIDSHVMNLDDALNIDAEKSNKDMEKLYKKAQEYWDNLMKLPRKKKVSFADYLKMMEAAERLGKESDANTGVTSSAANINAP